MIELVEFEVLFVNECGGIGEMIECERSDDPEAMK